MATQSLKDRFDALQAERERSWTAEQLAKNVALRADLVARLNPEAHAQPGDRIGPFTLLDADGQAIRSVDLVRNGPAVLLFFRFGTCPACNIAIPYYDETLWPTLNDLGIPLIAVSAQIPVDRDFVARHTLRLSVASDPDYALSRQLGITFFPDDQPAVVPGEAWIGATLGTHSYEMVQPTVLVLDTDHKVRFIAISPDWLARPEADTILSALAEARSVKAL